MEKSGQKPEYFLLRPEIEKSYGYSHAVKIEKALTTRDLKYRYMATLLKKVR